MDYRKSTSGSMMTFTGEAISWQSRLQKCVVLSSMKEKYIVFIEVSKEFLWM